MSADTDVHFRAGPAKNMAKIDHKAHPYKYLRNTLPRTFHTYICIFTESHIAIMNYHHFKLYHAIRDTPFVTISEFVHLTLTHCFTHMFFYQAPHRFCCCCLNVDVAWLRIRIYIVYANLLHGLCFLFMGVQLFVLCSFSGRSIHSMNGTFKKAHLVENWMT